jgi:hypothetical protein
MTKIKKINFYVDYTNPINLAVTPGIKIIGSDVFTYDTVFNAYSDSNLFKTNSTMRVRSVLYKDPTNKTLTGQGNCACSFKSRGGSRVDVYKSADQVHTLWMDIKHNPSKKRYTLRYQEHE